jgi:hypothetical protein
LAAGRIRDGLVLLGRLVLGRGVRVRVTVRVVVVVAPSPAPVAPERLLDRLARRIELVGLAEEVLVVRDGVLTLGVALPELALELLL